MTHHESRQGVAAEGAAPMSGGERCHDEHEMVGEMRYGRNPGGARVVAVGGPVQTPVEFIRDCVIPVNPMGAWVEVLAERDALLAEVARLHGECRDAHERIERVKKVHKPQGVHWCFDSDGQGDYVYPRDDGSQCPTLTALGPDGETE